MRVSARASALRRVAVLTAVTGLLMTGVAGAAPEGDDLDADRPKTETASLLFVMSATGGAFTPRAGDAGVYDLALTGVSPETLWFTDRPDRQADTAPTATAIDMVGFGPKETPPNAVVDVKDGPGAHDAIAVKLEAPKYDATSGTLAFTATVLPKPGKGSDIAGFGSRLDTAIPETFETVSLFVDDADTEVGDDGAPVQVASYPVYAAVIMSLGGGGAGQSFVYDSWSTCSLSNTAGPWTTTKDHDQVVISMVADEGFIDGCFSKLTWTAWEFHVTSPVDGWFRLDWGERSVGGDYELKCDVQPYPSRRTMNCKETGVNKVEITG